MYIIKFIYKFMSELFSWIWDFFVCCFFTERIENDFQFFPFILFSFFSACPQKLGGVISWWMNTEHSASSCVLPPIPTTTTIDMCWIFQSTQFHYMSEAKVCVWFRVALRRSCRNSFSSKEFYTRRTAWNNLILCERIIKSLIHLSRDNLINSCEMF